MNHRLALRVLLILSLLNAAFSAVAYLGVALLLPQMQTIYGANPGMLPPQFGVMWERMASIPRVFYAVWAVLCGLSFAGCILMWHLRRAGYHTYAIAQLLLLLLPLLFLGKGYVGLGDLMFTALFLLVYWLLLRELGVFGDSRQA